MATSVAARQLPIRDKQLILMARAMGLEGGLARLARATDLGVALGVRAAE